MGRRARKISGRRTLMTPRPVANPIFPVENDRRMPDAPYREYEKLVEITILGKQFKVPEKNTCLRAFQYVSPETVPYGRFCWNQDCQLCRVAYQMPDDPGGETRSVLACKVLVAERMEIVELSDELRWTLRAALKISAKQPPG